MMKTRYAILDPVPETEPGVIPCNPRDLETLTWVDCEFKGDKPTYEELTWLLDPLFPDAENWERVAVNSFKGPTDMFVDELGAGPFGLKPLPVNGLATLVYWTASLMHKLHAGESMEALRLKALLAAAELLGTQSVPKSSTLAGLGGWADVPRIHGRAVLFEDGVWS